MAVKLERQTDLGLEELAANIKDPNCVRKCFYISEIGTVFVNKEDGCKEAEAILLKLLRGKRDEKFFAYCYLTYDSKRSDRVIQALRFFRSKPKNQKIIKEARVVVRQRRKKAV